MTYFVTVERDKEPCPLQKVIMFTARCESHKIYSGGFTRDQAVKTVYRRITEEIGDSEPKLWVETVRN